MLTTTEKQQLQRSQGWSAEITDFIRDMEEAEVYIKAGLKEGRVNGKAALINPLHQG